MTSAQRRLGFYAAVDEYLDSRCASVDVENVDWVEVEQLQTLLLHVLGNYWVQRYLTHCKATSLPELSPKSDSCEALLKEVTDIDRALASLQGKFPYRAKIKGLKAEFNWRAMFPDHVVDDSFLTGGEEMMTFLRDGDVSVHRADSDSFERMIRRFLSETDSDTAEPEVTLPESGSTAPIGKLDHDK